jgi:hypothetical protein
MKKNLLSLLLVTLVSGLSFAQINVTGPIAFDSIAGGSLIPIYQGSAGTMTGVPKVTGSLNSVSIDAELTLSAAFTYANDLTIFVSASSDLTDTTDNYLLQIGGYSPLSTNKFLWGCEPTCDTDDLGTAVSGTVSSFVALNFGNTTNVIWIGNGYLATGAIGSWTLNSLSLGGLTLDVTGIKENSLSASVYPNPATDVLNIKIDEAIENVVVTSIDGKVVANATSGSVDISVLNAGVYVYNVTTVTGKTAKGNFIKK